jgi:Rrf2 family protein
MRITYRGDYALKAMLDLTLHLGELVTIHELAERADIPIKFLEQVLLDLKRGGFVESRRGNVGGYLLAKKPEDITVGAVVRFIDGPAEPIACIKTEYQGCRDAYNCVFRKIWSEVSTSTNKIIDGISFKDLALKAGKPKGELVYHI